MRRRRDRHGYRRARFRALHQARPRAQRRGALRSARGHHRPRGRLPGGLLGNCAAAKRLPPPGPRRTPARHCLPDGITPSRVRADRPRSPAADARDPPSRARRSTRQLTVFG